MQTVLKYVFFVLQIDKRDSHFFLQVLLCSDKVIKIFFSTNIFLPLFFQWIILGSESTQVSLQNINQERKEIKTNEDRIKIW